MDIYPCIEVLGKKPGIFQKNNIAEKLRCLDILRDSGKVFAIHSLINHLHADNKLIRQKTAETILSLFSRLKSLNDYTKSLRSIHLTVADLNFYKSTFDEETYVRLLSIASLNYDGFIREEAIDRLMQTGNSTGLRFILLRLGDWVSEVRKSAQRATFHFLNNHYLEDLIRELPTIEWLLKVERVDLRDMHDYIIGFIANRDLSEGLYERIKLINDKSRLLFYKSLLALRKPTEEIIKMISSDKNSLIRFELLKHFSSLDAGMQRLLINKFLGDESAGIRFDILYKTKSFQHEFDAKVLAALSDSSFSVRERSRYLLKDSGIDFAALYRERIATGKNLINNLAGLGETGSMEDVALFEQYFDTFDIKLSTASLIAINKFHPDKARDLALKLLARHEKISFKVLELIARNYNQSTLQTIRLTYIEANEKGKQLILNLLHKTGYWGVVGDFIYALSDDSEEVRYYAWQLIKNWCLSAVKIFTPPPPKEIEYALRNFDAVDKNKLTKEQLAFLPELRMYLK